MKKNKVLVLMGGGSSEHEVSLASGNEVLKNLDKEKYEVVPMIMETPKLDLEKVKNISPDVVFIALHGGVGEGGDLQKIFEDNKIKFIGCGSESSRLGLDKVDFLELMDKNSLPIPRGMIVKKGELVDLDKVKELGNKWVVKPVSQGSSVGVTILDDLNNLDKALDLVFGFEETAIIEEFVSGMEVSSGVIGNPSTHSINSEQASSGQIMALPIIEICPKNKFFDYEAKYTDGKCEEIVPARLSNEVTKKIQEYSLKVFELVKARGFIRVDYIVKNDIDPVILEMNTIPGLTPNSLLPKEAKAAGMEYPKLLDKMIELALE
jgi:D-alanine-D-alanine ligase